MYQRSLATSSSAALDPDIYTVGWICALDIEASIACEFLDKKDDLDKSLARADVNRYTLGTIGAHKVVIATIPPAGDSSATSISSRVKDMLYTFPNIRVALSVGIGSGVPAYCDIRLGDVVVGIPKDGRGGVVQYELDDSFGNTAVRLAETVYAPSRAMLNTIVSQRDEYPDVEEQIRDVIGSILDANPILREKYRRPKPETDVLSHANTVRQGNMYEGSYSKASGRAIHRPRRPDRLYDCVVYYGTVASGTSHIFDTFTRDKLVANNDVLCFENEAAGLTDRFRYLAIRGISEYSDSHGTEEWQRFAAMAAAAFAKSLLVRTPLQLIEKEMKIKDALSLGKYSSLSFHYFKTISKRIGLSV